MWVRYRLRLQSGCWLCLSPPGGGNTLVKKRSRASPTCFLSSQEKKKAGVTKNMHQPHHAQTRNERNSGRVCGKLPTGQSRLNVSTFQRLKLCWLRQVSGWLFVWKAELRARNEGKRRRKRQMERERRPRQHVVRRQAGVSDVRQKVTTANPSPTSWTSLT